MTTTAELIASLPIAAGLVVTGQCLTTRHDDGTISVVRADPAIEISIGLLDRLDPTHAHLDDDVLTINAANGTFRYRLTTRGCFGVTVLAYRVTG